MTYLNGWRSWLSLAVVSLISSKRSRGFSRVEAKFSHSHGRSIAHLLEIFLQIHQNLGIVKLSFERPIVPMFCRMRSL